MKWLWFVAVLFALSPAVAAEDPDPLSRDRDLQQTRVALEEMRASRERMEKGAPLAARAVGLLKAERYAEAEQALADWEAVDPEDPRLPPLKELASKLKAEPDPIRQSDLWSAYLNATLEELQPREKQNFVHRDR